MRQKDREVNDLQENLISGRGWNCERKQIW